jgi:hypothetical protein
MSGAHIRIRRLSRLAARAHAAVREAERGLAKAAGDAVAAAERRASIDTIVAETRPTLGSAGVESLLAGAHLRQLLRPAATAAAAAQDASVAARTAAERRLTTACARADGLTDRLAAARRLAGAETERRMADMTPTARSRR